MSRTVTTFWQTIEDEAEFLKYVERTGEIVVYPFGKRSSKDELAPRALSAYIAQSDRDAVLFSPKEFSERVIVSEFVDRDRAQFVISPEDSAVIGYDPAKMSNDRLAPSNAYVYWKVLVGNRLSDQPEGFLKWGRALFRWLKRHADQRLDGYDLPMTRGAAVASKQGIELVKY